MIDENEVEERMPVVIMGVVIGTHNGWDNYGDNGIQFLEFEPARQFKEFFWGETEISILALDLYADVFEPVGYLEETEVKFDGKKFLQLLAAE